MEDDVPFNWAMVNFHMLAEQFLFRIRGAEGDGGNGCLAKCHGRYSLIG